MDEYAQVNDPLYPFVYGNPDGYGSNTNSDPFAWGQPQAPKFCDSQTIELSKPAQSVQHGSAGEGFCDSCASGSSNYQDRDTAQQAPQQDRDIVQQPVDQRLNRESDNHQSSISSNSSNSINNSSIKTLEKRPEADDANDANERAVVARDFKRQLRDARTVLIAKSTSENYTAGHPYGSVSKYGTGSVGNGTIPNAPVVPVSYYENFSGCGAMVGQYPPATITPTGGIAYTDESLAQQAGRTQPQQRRSFCEATNGGKKLAF